MIADIRSKLLESRFDIEGVSEDDDVHHEAQRAELVFLPLSITLAEFTPLAMKDRPRQFVPVLAAIQLRERPPPFGFIVYVCEAVNGLVDASELGDRLGQFRWAVINPKCSHDR